MQGLVSSRGRAAINKNSEKCKMILDESLLQLALCTRHFALIQTSSDDAP